MKSKLPIRVFEKVPGSRICWIRFNTEGQMLREKVGSLAAAKNRPGVCQIQPRAGALQNPPEPRPQKIDFADPIDDANKHLKSEWTSAHAYDTALKFNRT